jgi:hypothetical protein
MIHRSVGSKDHRVCWDVDRMGRGLWIVQITLIICYQIKLDKLNIYKTLMCSVPKMCWFICIRFCTASSHCLSLSSAVVVSAVRELRVDKEVEVLVCRRA